MKLQFTPALVLSFTCLSLSACGESESENEAEGGAAPVNVEGYLPSEVPEGFVVHDLGDINIEDGLSASLTFEAGPNTQAFYVVAVAPDDRFLAVMQATTPDGEEIVHPEPSTFQGANTSYGLSGPATSPNRSIPRPHAAATMFPNTPKIAMKPGTWSFRVGAYFLEWTGAEIEYTPVGLDGSLHVYVIERTAPALEKGKLDLIMGFGASSGINAASAPESPVIKGLLAQINASYESVGVSIGDVQYYDVPDAPTSLDLTGDGGPSCLGGPETVDAVSQLSELSGSNRAIRLLFIDAFECTWDINGEKVPLGSNLVGVSNGIPGVPFATADGLIIATHLAEQYPADYPLVIAHELGHFLGLTHTCDGKICDNLDDTPTANPEANLMFHNVSEVTDSTLSPDQGKVIRLHPAVH